MPINLKGRSILTLDELSAAEIRFLLRLRRAQGRQSPPASAAAAQGQEHRPDLREGGRAPRTGFEVAAYDQGAHVTYLGPSGSQIGHKESMKDTARVLGRMYDAIEYRGFGQQSAEELAAYAGVPSTTG